MTHREDTPPARGVLGETVLNLAQAAARLPGHRDNARLHPVTIQRWILAGIRAPGGRLVRLEAVRVGSRWLTSAEAIDRFAAALTSSAEAPEPPRGGGVATPADLAGLKTTATRV
jgi:hypothetical protein